MRPRGIMLAVLALGLMVAQQALGDDKARIEAEAQGQAAQADKLFKAGEFAAAIPFYEAERVSRKAVGDQRFEAYAIRSIGCCHEGLGDHEAAIEAWRRARVLDSKRDDHGYEGYDLYLIGRAHLRLGRLEQAQEILTNSLPLLSQAIDRDHEADARLVLALAYLKDDRPEDAAPHVDRAERVANALDDTRRRAMAWLAGGYIALAQESPGLAAERFSDARDGFVEARSPSDAAEADRCLAQAYHLLENTDAATFFGREAVAEHWALHDHSAVADDLRILAEVRASAEDFPGAVRYARQAVEARRAADDLVGGIDARVELALYQQESGALDEAWKTLDETVSLARQGVPAARRVRLFLLASEIAEVQGLTSRSNDLLEEADRVANAADNGALRRMVRDARTERRERP